MEDFPLSVLRLLLGFGLGVALGFVARRGRFCTLGAIEDAAYANDNRRLLSWVVAIGVAIAGVHALELWGGLDLSRSIYLSARLEWGGLILGGLLFGIGMALNGTCGLGTLRQLGGGDLKALVSFLEAKGTPSIVERALIAPPQGRVGPLTPAERAALIQQSPLRGKYDEAVDNESAYEMLAQRKHLDSAPAEAASQSEGGLSGMLGGLLGGLFGGSEAPAQKGKGTGKGTGRTRRPPPSLAEQVLGNAARSMARKVGTEVGDAILRNVLGGLTKR